MTSGRVGEGRLSRVHARRAGAQHCTQCTAPAAVWAGLADRVGVRRVPQANEPGKESKAGRVHMAQARACGEAYRWAKRI